MSTYHPALPSEIVHTKYHGEEVAADQQGRFVFEEFIRVLRLTRRDATRKWLCSARRRRALGQCTRRTAPSRARQASFQGTDERYVYKLYVGYRARIHMVPAYAMVCRGTVSPDSAMYWDLLTLLNSCCLVM